MSSYGVRRLIEVDMPIGMVSEHSRHDQNVKKGHLHTLHVWWGTRPLAACRAVLMATLLPDPADENCPEAFRREAREALKPFTGRDLSGPAALRQALLEFIGHFAAWENSTHRAFVETALRLVRAAHPEGPPLVVDPFAGIGSIPFEALRIGADAFAGDLNRSGIGGILSLDSFGRLRRHGGARRPDHGDRSAAEPRSAAGFAGAGAEGPGCGSSRRTCGRARKVGQPIGPKIPGRKLKPTDPMGQGKLRTNMPAA